MFVLDPQTLLACTAEQVHRQKFLVCETGIAVVAVSHAQVFQPFVETVAYKHIDFDKLICLLTVNHNQKRFVVNFSSKLLIISELAKFWNNLIH